MVDCPFCDYTAEKPGSVIAHATSKTDEAHKGVGGQQVKAMLEAQETVNGNGDSEATEAPTEQPLSTDGENPAFDEPDVENEPTDDENDPNCPNCGGELVDYREYDYDPQGRGPTPFDYLCSQCQRTWDTA